MDLKGENKEENKKILGKAELITFASDLGISIALPLCILAYVGKKLDDHMGTFPRIFIVAILLSFFVTTVIIYFKIKKYIKHY